MTSIFSTLIGKISLGAIALLVIFCMYLMYSNKSKESDITVLTSKVSEISNRNSVLESQLVTAKKQVEVANHSFGIQQKVLDELSKNERESLEKLNKITPQGKKNGETTVNSSTPLPASVVRVLSDHCNKVRGSTCTNAQ